jgi:hypothetical protein
LAPPQPRINPNFPTATDDIDVEPEIAVRVAGKPRLGYIYLPALNWLLWNASQNCPFCPLHLPPCQKVGEGQKGQIVTALKNVVPCRYLKIGDMIEAIDFLYLVPDINQIALQCVTSPSIQPVVSRPSLERSE